MRTRFLVCLGDESVSISLWRCMINWGLEFYRHVISKTFLLVITICIWIWFYVAYSCSGSRFPLYVQTSTFFWFLRGKKWNTVCMSLYLHVFMLRIPRGIAGFCSLCRYVPFNVEKLLNIHWPQNNCVWKTVSMNSKAQKLSFDQSTKTHALLQNPILVLWHSCDRFSKHTHSSVGGKLISIPQQQFLTCINGLDC